MSEKNMAFDNGKTAFQYGISTETEVKLGSKIAAEFIGFIAVTVPAITFSAYNLRLVVVFYFICCTRVKLHITRGTGIQQGLNSWDNRPNENPCILFYRQYSFCSEKTLRSEHRHHFIAKHSNEQEN